MDQEWQYQLRVYLPEALAETARREGAQPALQPLTEILDRHQARLVGQFDAFEAYVAEAEREGVEKYPLYRWTKATVLDPKMRAKHSTTFSLHIDGQEVYPKAAADALEADLRPLIGGDLVTRMTKHDTNPANNIPVPPEYR